MSRAPSFPGKFTPQRDPGDENQEERESICAEADRIVSNDRNDFYGHPFDNYRRIAGAVAALEIDASTPEGSILLMIVTKVAREVHRPKRDNRVDICGYAKALDLLHEEKSRRGL